MFHLITKHDFFSFFMLIRNQFRYMLTFYVLYCKCDGIYVINDDDNVDDICEWLNVRHEYYYY